MINEGEEEEEPQENEEEATTGTESADEIDTADKKKLKGKRSLAGVGFVLFMRMKNELGMTESIHKDAAVKVWETMKYVLALNSCISR